MQVSVETTQGLERRLTITVPAATVDAAVRKELNGLAKTRRIDGFRPGKAPVAIIKKMFGAMAHARVADEMMQNNFIKAIIESKLSRPQNLSVFRIPTDAAQSLAALAERSMQLQATVQEGVLTLGDSAHSVDIECKPWLTPRS